MNLCINATRMNSSAYTVTWLLKWYKVILILFTTSLQQQELISSVSSTGPNRPGARAYSLFMSHKFAPNCIYVVFFAFRCQKRLSASRVMVSNIWSVFFFFSKVKQNMYNKSAVEIRVMAVYLAPVILYKYTRSKLENAKEHSRQALRKGTSFSGLHEALTCWWDSTTRGDL